jgi:hypothetical protein
VLTVDAIRRERGGVDGHATKQLHGASREISQDLPSRTNDVGYKRPPGGPFISHIVKLTPDKHPATRLTSGQEQCLGATSTRGPSYPSNQSNV